MMMTGVGILRGFIVVFSFFLFCFVFCCCCFFFWGGGGGGDGQPMQDFEYQLNAIACNLDLSSEVKSAVKAHTLLGFLLFVFFSVPIPE